MTPPGVKLARELLNRLKHLLLRASLRILEEWKDGTKT